MKKKLYIIPLFIAFCLIIYGLTTFLMVYVVPYIASHIKMFNQN